MRPRPDRWAAPLLGIALLAGCAHRQHLRPAYDTHGRRALYRAALDERRSVPLVTAALTLWLERGGRRLPGAAGEMTVAAPDRARLRVDSSFGTLLDVAARRDSLLAYVPSWRAGLAIPAGDSLHVPRLGELVVRALSGAWDPPESAWAQGAMWTDSLLEISWFEAGDSLRMGISGDGLPEWIRLSGPEHDIRVAYRSWDRSAGAPWPVWLVVDSRRDDLRLTLRPSRIRLARRVDELRLAPRIPESARTLTVEDLRALIARLGEP